MTTAPLQSRFQILEKPIRHPGKCAVCGSGTKPVVDMGITVQGYGVVYFCVEDLTDLASVIGMVSESEVSGLRIAAEQSVSEYLAQNNLKVVPNDWYDVVSASVSSLSFAVHDIGVRIGLATDGPTGEEVSAESDESAESGSGDDSGNSEATGQDSDSSVDEGPTSVPADSSDEREPESFSF